MKAFSESRIPVFLGETTSRYPDSNFAPDAKYKTSSECLKIILEKLTAKGFVPVLWDVTDNFYSRSTNSVIDPKDAEVISALAKK